MKKLIQLFLFTLCFTKSTFGASADNGKFDWMNADIGSLISGGTLPACVEVPQFANLSTSSRSLNLDNSGQWVATGVKVGEDKLLQMEWNTAGVEPRPDKYKVLYRIDPRFKTPQVFIQEYDYQQQKYISDFHQYKNGQLLRYQDRPEMTYDQRLTDFVDYFNFSGRSKIQIKKDDVVNISLDDQGSFFAANTEMTGELGTGVDPLFIYTASPIQDNRIIYTDSTNWCNSITPYAPFDPSITIQCVTPGIYLDFNNNLGALTGIVSNTGFSFLQLLLLPCPSGANGPDNDPLCFYDQGRGMALAIGGTVIKPTADKFTLSPFSGKNFLYHKSDSDGELDFISDWLIEDMYADNFSHFMDEWVNDGLSDYSLFRAYMVANLNTMKMNFLHFGRYLMNVEIGNSKAVISDTDKDAIQIEYVIMENGTPDGSTAGTSIDNKFRGNASSSGYLWLRVINPNSHVSGTINVNIANYTGHTFFSDIIYGMLIKPLRDKFNELTKTIYEKLISNVEVQNIARASLTLYIIIYGLMFLIGAVKITSLDIVVRTIKIAVIIALFSETSWNFFNNNFFNIFISGIDQLMTSVVGTTSNVNSIFGFVDPIVDKYTNPSIWKLLAIQLLIWHNGIAFFTMMTIFGITIYFRAVVEIIISYCLAFIGLAVMISLAPFFIVMMLFEKTKGMFDRWISTMFSYMIKPTILLIFFLLIDQMMSEHIIRTVSRACWDSLIPIKLALDLNHMGIPLDFNVTLPFLPFIPFYVSQPTEITSIGDILNGTNTVLGLATSSLIFYAYCRLAYGLVHYTELIVQYLTNVQAARQDGMLQAIQNPVKDIMGDMQRIPNTVMGKARGYTTRALSGAGGFMKDKLIDQKISHRGKSSLPGVEESKIYTTKGQKTPSEKPGSNTPSSQKKLNTELGSKQDKETRTGYKDVTSEYEKDNKSTDKIKTGNKNTVKDDKDD